MRLIYIFSLFIFTLVSCEKYFGDETNIDFIDKPVYQTRDIAYIPIFPIIKNFVAPSDIITGFDELLYVVDEGSEEIISLDESGKELGRFKVKGAKSIAQDRKLDLLVIGTQSKTISGINYDLTCIYRIDLHGSNGMYGLKHAKIINEIVHPFYFKSTFSSSDKWVNFNKIVVMPDNRYYVARQGQSNASNQFGGPDDAVLLFNQKDIYITPVTVTTADGNFYTNYFKSPTGLCGTLQPPQITARGNQDFMFTSLDPNNGLKFQYIQYNETEFGASYNPRIQGSGDPTLGSGFIMDPFKFKEPVSLILSGDGTNLLFIVDRAKDSIFQFSNNGIEGIKPPPGSASNQYQKTSFGGYGTGPMQFNKPSAAAFKNKILYVTDKGNGRLLRFKLTTDFD